MKTLAAITMTFFRQLMTGHCLMKTHAFHGLHSLGRGSIIVFEENDYSAN